LQKAKKRKRNKEKLERDREDVEVQQKGWLLQKIHVHVEVLVGKFKFRMSDYKTLVTSKCESKKSYVLVPQTD